MFNRFAQLSPSRRTIYAVNLLVSFHYFIVIYLNSVLLANYTTTQAISLLYIVGSLLCLVFLAVFARAIKRLGNYSLMIVMLVMEIIALAGMATAQSFAPLAISFILFLGISPLIYLGLDIFLEMGPARKFYTLTDEGREELQQFWLRWDFVSSKINELKEKHDESLG